MEKSLYSAIDANVNRAIEGVRVCEDLLRFTFRLLKFSKKLKVIRHKIRLESNNFPIDILLHARDVENDEQKFIDLDSEKNRDSILDILKANLHRTIEAIRCLEEFSKIVENVNSSTFQEIRFSLYAIEKEILQYFFSRKKIHRFENSLYSILDSSFVKDEKYYETAIRLINSGTSILQLRMKNEFGRKIFHTAKKISELCREREVVFIMNDYPDIALLCQADGVHLGQDDIPIAEARRLLPQDMIIGISTHSYDQAIIAVNDNSDYIAIGPVFDTKSKTGITLNAIDMNDVSKVANDVTVPVVAIGGISSENIHIIKKCGINCFAVISDLFKENEIESNCKKIIGEIERDE